MVETKAVVIRPTEDLDTMTLGKVLAESGYFGDAKSQGQAIVKILAGRELGFGPIASMTGIYIVQGRVTLSATLMAAAIKRSGRYTYRVKRLDNEACEVEFFEGTQSIGVSSFAAADAVTAGLQGKDVWQKFRRNMLFARALSNGARWYCPDIFGGPVYTPEELGAPADPETGEIIAQPARPEPASVPAQPQAPVPNANPQPAPVSTAASAPQPAPVTTTTTTPAQATIPQPRPLAEYQAKYQRIVDVAGALGYDAAPLPANGTREQIVEAARAVLAHLAVHVMPGVAVNVDRLEPLWDALWKQARHLGISPKTAFGPHDEFAAQVAAIKQLRELIQAHVGQPEGASGGH